MKPVKLFQKTIAPGAWETAATIRETWGYKKNDHDWKKPGDICFKLDNKGRLVFTPKTDWRCTTKPGENYIQLFKWPGDRISVAQPKTVPSDIATVLCLELKD